MQRTLEFTLYCNKINCYLTFKFSSVFVQSPLRFLINVQCSVPLFDFLKTPLSCADTKNLLLDGQIWTFWNPLGLRNGKSTRPVLTFNFFKTVLPYCTVIKDCTFIRDLIVTRISNFADGSNTKQEAKRE